MSEPIVLGIESTCDETAAAVVQGRTLISNVVASSMDEHARYGGVIPEIASRAHAEAFVPCVSKALADANMTLSDVDAIAVSAGPGLAGCLAVGVSGAKSLAWAANKPIYGINHVIGHIAVTQLQFGPFPKDTLALICVGAGTLRCCMSKTWRGISTWSAPLSTTLPANASTRWRVCLVSRIPAAAHRPSRAAGQPTCHQSASGPYTRQGGAAASVRFQFLRREDGRGALDRTAADGRQ